MRPFKHQTMKDEKMKRLSVIVAAIALTACAHNPPVSVQAAESCPPVPKCEAYPPEEIATNADMVQIGRAHV